MSSMTPALQSSIVAAAILARQNSIANGPSVCDAAMGASAAAQFIAALNAGTAVAADAWPLLRAMHPDNVSETVSASFVATLAASH